MSTHSDQMTHSAAAQWKSTVQQRRRRSMLEMSRLRHCRVEPPQNAPNPIDANDDEAKQCQMRISKKGERNKLVGRQYRWIDRIDDAHLVEGLDFGVHDEGELAEFTGIGRRCGEPLLQACLMHILQAAGTVAGR